jgi:hypothetical protein
MNALVPIRAKLWITVRVRVEGKTREHVALAAQQMGVQLGRVYPMRGGQGFMGYGTRKVELS